MFCTTERVVWWRSHEEKEDAEEHRSDAPGTSQVAEINSKTCKRQWNLLGRVANGPRAAQFPQLAEMFRGDNNSKLKALKLYMDANEDLGQCESQITVQKTHMETFNHKRKWLTIKQMKEAGFSETFGCNFVLYCFAKLQCLHILCFDSWHFAATRKKIQACVARGGMADPDAPLDDESTRYRASLEMEEDEKFQNKTSLTTKGVVSNADAFSVFRQGNPQAAATVMSADPMALVRQQLALQAPAAPAAPPAAAPARGGAGSVLAQEMSNQLGWILLCVNFSRSACQARLSRSQKRRLKQFHRCLKSRWRARQSKTRRYSYVLSLLLWIGKRWCHQLDSVHDHSFRQRSQKRAQCPAKPQAWLRRSQQSAWGKRCHDQAHRKPHCPLQQASFLLMTFWYRTEVSQTLQDPAGHWGSRLCAHIEEDPSWCWYLRFKFKDQRSCLYEHCLGARIWHMV